jgi:hypothetical protein
MSAAKKSVAVLVETPANVPGSTPQNDPSQSPPPPQDAVNLLLVGLALAGYPLDAVLNNIRDIIATAEKDKNQWSDGRVMNALVPIVAAHFTPAVHKSLLRTLAEHLHIVARIGGTTVSLGGQ